MPIKSLKLENEHSLINQGRVDMVSYVIEATEVDGPYEYYEELIHYVAIGITDSDCRDGYMHSENVFELTIKGLKVCVARTVKDSSPTSTNYVELHRIR